MKQFLYLDYKMVDSIIAQNEKGIILSIQNEEESNQQSSNELSVDISGQADLSGSFLKMLEAKSNVAINRERSNEELFANGTKDIITKALHDASFDIALTYMNPYKIEFDNNECDYGQYCEIKRVFDYIDLDYIDKLFSKDGISDFLKKQAKQEAKNKVDEQLEGLDRDQQRRIKNQIKSMADNLAKELSSQYDYAHDVIEVFKKVIPYSRMLISNDGFLIPLDDDFFRVKPDNLGFKYGGEMTCIGAITNLIGEDTNPNDNKNIFATLQYSVNELLRSVLPTPEKNIYVVHPIAIYYETSGSAQ